MKTFLPLGVTRRSPPPPSQLPFYPPSSSPLLRKKGKIEEEEEEQGWASTETEENAIVVLTEDKARSEEEKEDGGELPQKLRSFFPLLVAFLFLCCALFIRSNRFLGDKGRVGKKSFVWALTIFLDLTSSSTSIQRQ